MTYLLLGQITAITVDQGHLAAVARHQLGLRFRDLKVGRAGRQNIERAGGGGGLENRLFGKSS